MALREGFPQATYDRCAGHAPSGCISARRVLSADRRAGGAELVTPSGPMVVGFRDLRDRHRHRSRGAAGAVAFRRQHRLTGPIATAADAERTGRAVGRFPYLARRLRAERARGGQDAVDRRHPSVQHRLDDELRRLGLLDQRHDDSRAPAGLRADARACSGPMSGGSGRNSKPMTSRRRWCARSPAMTGPSFLQKRARWGSAPRLYERSVRRHSEPMRATSMRIWHQNSHAPRRHQFRRTNRARRNGHRTSCSDDKPCRALLTSTALPALAQTRAETLRHVTGAAINTLDPNMPGSTREAFGLSLLDLRPPGLLRQEAARRQMGLRPRQFKPRTGRELHSQPRRAEDHLQAAPGRQVP